MPKYQPVKLIQDYFHTLKSIKFVRFLGVGVMNTLFGYIVFAFFLWLNIDYRVAAFLSTVLGILFNFNTIGRIVFANRNNKFLFRFICVYLFIYVLNVEGLRIAKALHINLYLAAALMLLPMAVISFFLNKIFVFRS